MSPSETSPTVVSFGEDLLERMEQAVRKVQERLERCIKSLELAAIPFAIAGSNATSIWISSIDVSAIRQARNVEIVLRRNDLQRAELVLGACGFVMRMADNAVRFLDGSNGKWRDGIEITFESEPIAGKSTVPMAPDLEQIEIVGGYKVLRLAPLVEYQLARYRLDDAVDLRDMIDVGLIDRHWLDKFPPNLALRLQQLLDTPDG